MNGFVNTFGGSAISPADVAFREYSISSDFQLFWPEFSYGQTNIAARFMNISASVANLNVFMPDALLVSPGYDVVIFNAGAQTIDVVDYDGGAIATIPAGKTFYILVKDNATQAGSWQTVQFGVGTGSADAAALAGAGLLAIAGMLNVNLDATLVSNDYTITTTARAVLQVWTGGAGAIELPPASSVGNGFFFALANNGSGNVVVTAVGGDTIDGEPTSTFTQTNSGFIIASGGAWYTVGKGVQNTIAVTLLNLNVSGNTDVTETSAQAANILQQFTGTLTGNINVIMPNTVQLYYIFNNTMGAFSLTVKTAAGTGVTVAQGTHTILYCDGTNIVNGYTASVASTVSISAGTANAPNFNFVGNANTGIYSPATDQIAMTAGGFEVMNFVSEASSINYLQSSASATGNAVSISALGGDTNISLNLITKGTGRHNFLSNGGVTQFFVGNVSSAVNVLSVTSAATANAPILAASGSDANISINYNSKGTGTHVFNAQIVGNLTGNVTGNVSGSSGSTTGNAATATALQTARMIGGVSFNGTADITVVSATAGFLVSGGDLYLAGSTSGTTAIKSNAIAGVSAMTLPTGVDTLVGKATTDTFTNKTFDTAGTGNALSIAGVAVTANTGTGAIVRAISPTFTGTVDAAAISATTVAASGAITALNIQTTTTSAGAATSAAIFSNSNGTLNTEVNVLLVPSTTSTRAAQIAAKNDGSNGISIVLRPSSGGTYINSITLPPLGGVVVNSATGSTGPGDVNITGSYLINGTALSTTPIAGSTTWTSGVTKTIALDFTTYSVYEIKIVNLIGTIDNSVTMDISSNNGSSYVTAVTNSRQFTTTAVSDGNGAITSSTGSTPGGIATITLTQPATNAGSEATYIGSNAASGKTWTGGNTYPTTAAINLIKFTMSNPATAGTILYYPVAKR